MHGCREALQQAKGSAVEIRHALCYFHIICYFSNRCDLRHYQEEILFSGIAISSQGQTDLSNSHPLEIHLDSRFSICSSHPFSQQPSTAGIAAMHVSTQQRALARTLQRSLRKLQNSSTLWQWHLRP